MRFRASPSAPHTQIRSEKGCPGKRGKNVRWWRQAPGESRRVIPSAGKGRLSRRGPRAPAESNLRSTSRCLPPFAGDLVNSCGAWESPAPAGTARRLAGIPAKSLLPEASQKTHHGGSGMRLPRARGNRGPQAAQARQAPECRRGVVSEPGARVPALSAARQPGGPFRSSCHPFSSLLPNLESGQRGLAGTRG